jgi:hypothetical protein
VSGHPHGQDLVRSQPEQVQQCGLPAGELAVGRGGDDHVVGALTPAGSGQQLGGERRIPIADPPLGQQLGQHQVGVRAVGADPAQGVEGNPAGAIRGAALPSRRRSGRRHQDPSIG